MHPTRKPLTRERQGGCQRKLGMQQAHNEDLTGRVHTHTCSNSKYDAKSATATSSVTMPFVLAYNLNTNTPSANANQLFTVHRSYHRMADTHVRKHAGTHKPHTSNDKHQLSVPIHSRPADDRAWLTPSSIIGGSEVRDRNQERGAQHIAGSPFKVTVNRRELVKDFPPVISANAKQSPQKAENQRASDLTERVCGRVPREGS